MVVLADEVEVVVAASVILGGDAVDTVLSFRDLSLFRVARMPAMRGEMARRSGRGYELKMIRGLR